MECDGGGAALSSFILELRHRFEYSSAGIFLRCRLDLNPLALQCSDRINDVVLVRSCAVTVGGPPTIEAGFHSEFNQFSEKQLAP